MKEFEMVFMWDTENNKPNVKGIMNFLPEMTDGIESVLNKNIGDMSFQVIINEILQGKLLLWVGFLKGKYIGFVTTRIDDNIGAKRYLSVIHLFIKKGESKEIFENGFAQLRAFGEKTNCDEMRMWTIRDGWERRLIPLGWKQTNIEYNLSLKELGK